MIYKKGEVKIWVISIIVLLIIVSIAVYFFNNRTTSATPDNSKIINAIDNSTFVENLQSSFCKALLGNDAQILEKYYLDNNLAVNQVVLNKFTKLNIIYTKDMAQAESLTDANERQFFLRIINGTISISDLNQGNLTEQQREPAEMLIQYGKAFNNADTESCKLLKYEFDQNLCKTTITKQCG